MISSMLRRLGAPDRTMQGVDSAAAAVRRTMARSPWWRAVVVAVAAAIMAWSVFHAAAAARTERAAWGTLVEVWVATADHAAGEPLRVERRSLPLVAVPVTARRTDPTGETARHAVAAGETVVDADVAPGRGITALAPPGTVVVAVSDPLVSDAALGAGVIVATEGIVLAADGIVTAVVDGVVHVAVPAADAPMVAAAARQSLASLLFPAIGPGSGED